MPKINPYTLEERMQLQELIRKGALTPQIARILNRTRNSIRNEIERHGGRKHYDPIKAQEWADTVKERRSQSLKKYHEKNPVFTTSTLKKRQARISERLSLLESQLEAFQKLLTNFKGK